MFDVVSGLIFGELSGLCRGLNSWWRARQVPGVNLLFWGFEGSKASGVGWVERGQ